MEPLCVFTSAFLCAIIRIWLSFTPNLCPKDRCLRVREVCGEKGAKGASRRGCYNLLPTFVAEAVPQHVLQHEPWGLHME
jgi:hypothetical protein